LSSAERQKVLSDPAVRQAMELFGGDLVGISRDANPDITAGGVETGDENDAEN
jgi:hypothetical protein